MADDASIGSNDQGLRNRVAPVHQRYRGLAVGPAQPEAEFEVARELLDPIGRRARIFSRQTDELYATPGKLFAHLLVFRYFPATRAAPGRPEVNHHDLATEVRKAEAAVVQRLDLARKNAFRQYSQLCGREGRALSRQHNWRFGQLLWRRRRWRHHASSARLCRGAGSEHGDQENQ